MRLYGCETLRKPSEQSRMASKHLGKNFWSCSSNGWCLNLIFKVMKVQDVSEHFTLVRGLGYILLHVHCFLRNHFVHPLDLIIYLMSSNSPLSVQCIYDQSLAGPQ